MTATELHERTEEAMTVTGAPEWASIETSGGRDTLAFLNAEAAEGEATWAFVSVDDGDEFSPLDVAAAETLIREHWQSWLRERAWQVQLTVRKDKPSWRLVDCLAFSDGGGDRLDDDYPFGDDRLTILAQSVLTVTRHRRPARVRGPA